MNKNTSCSAPTGPLTFQVTTTVASTSVELPYDATGTYSGIINWGDGNTSVNSYANRTHTYTTAGVYLVSLVTSSNCGSDSTQQFVLVGDTNTVDTSTVGVLPLTHESAVTLFPNPFDKSSVLLFENSNGVDFSLEITDLSGKTVQRYDHLMKGRVVISGSDLADGLYLYFLKGDYHVTGKMLIQHH